jgi:undecaprenyl-diphosphatase
MAQAPLDIMQIVVLALLQGITEFLPISSSAHLILVPALTDWPDQGTEIDVAVHVGTLAAVMIYFRRDLGVLLGGLGAGLAGRPTPATGLALKLLVATVPLILAGGLLVGLDLTDALRNPAVIAWATLGFAVLLYLVDRRARTVRRVDEVGIAGALFVGLCQVLALVPGASRAGVTITGARLLGIGRTEAARFSMLLSIPAILSAGGYAALKLVLGGAAGLGLAAVIAAVLAFLAALVSIAAMMAWLKRASYTPFVIYRLLLGGALLWWLYVG